MVYDVSYDKVSIHSTSHALCHVMCVVARITLNQSISVAVDIRLRAGNQENEISLKLEVEHKELAVRI